MAEGEMIDVRDLPERVRTQAAQGNNEESGELLPLAEVERRHVLRVLEQTGGNKVQAAKILVINRATVYRIWRSPRCQNLCEWELIEGALSPDELESLHEAEPVLASVR